MKKSTKKVCNLLGAGDRVRIYREMNHVAAYDIQTYGYERESRDKRIRRLIAENFSWKDLQRHPLWYIAYRIAYKARTKLSSR